MRSGPYLEETVGTRGLVFVRLKLLIILTCVFWIASCSYFSSNMRIDPAVVSDPQKVDQKQRGNKNGAEKKPGDTASKQEADDLASVSPKDAEKLENKVAQKESGSGSSSDSELTPLFKKHDHMKYLEKIKDTATELVSKESGSVFARLCKDSVTDEWSMSMYFFKDKVYWFVAYKWDEIDEKWEESFKSDERPIAVWKNHVNFSASGKECNILKGASRLK